MYAPMKTVVGADTDPTPLKKIAAGSASGAIATLITNPIELLKTRLQSNSTMGPLQILQKIVHENGVTGLWKGTMPSAVRPTLRSAPSNQMA
jgi:solute carrier family 25 uncoupling protein 8/9